MIAPPDSPVTATHTGPGPRHIAAAAAGDGSYAHPPGYGPPAAPAAAAASAPPTHWPPPPAPSWPSAHGPGAAPPAHFGYSALTASGHGAAPFVYSGPGHVPATGGYAPTGPPHSSLRHGPAGADPAAPLTLTHAILADARDGRNGWSIQESAADGGARYCFNKVYGWSLWVQPIT